MTDRFGPPPPLARSLLYVVTLRALCRVGGVQSIIAEGDTAVVKMDEAETLPAAALESVVPRGVQVGRTLMRISLDEGWEERLQRALELLVEKAEEAEAAVS
jgi:transcription-repair coupling factor (superfamily II helicase)